MTLDTERTEPPNGIFSLALTPEQDELVEALALKCCFPKGSGLYRLHARLAGGRIESELVVFDEKSRVIWQETLERLAQGQIPNVVPHLEGNSMWNEISFD